MTAPNASASVTGFSVPTSGTGGQALPALLDGEKWGAAVGTGVTLSYSFPWTTNAQAVFSGAAAGGGYSTLNEPSGVSHFGLSSIQQSAARSALEAWAAVANIKWTELAETSLSVGDVRFAWTSVTQSNAWGWGYMPGASSPVSGDIWLSTGGSQGSEWAAGSYNYQALMHEVGHALGLKHPFEGASRLSGAEDSWRYSLMSYTEAVNGTFSYVTSTGPNGYYEYTVKDVSPDTPMLYDVLAMQYMYGANMSYRTGDDVYTFDSATPFFRTLWDAGGTDTLSVANFTRGCQLDLRDGHFSSIRIPSASPGTYTGEDNLAIAYGCAIENAQGGEGDDVLIGNAMANVLNGGGGNDTLQGNEGNDQFYGGFGVNVLDGGSGLDTQFFAAARAQYAMTRSSVNGSVSVQASNGTESNTLYSIERLRFADCALALDVSGAAGQVVKLVGALFGNWLAQDMATLGVGIAFADAGMGYEDLAGLALRAAKVSDNEQLVRLLWAHVVRTEPTQADVARFVGMLDAGMSQAGLVMLAADTDLNAAHVQLTGLAATGVAYLPYSL